MIETNVDRIVKLLSEKRTMDVKAIAKQLGANQESVDLILSYLEEDGVVQLKYGVIHTTARLKPRKVPVKPPVKPPVEAAVPKPPAAKPAILAPSLRRIPGEVPAPPAAPAVPPAPVTPPVTPPVAPPVAPPVVTAPPITARPLPKVAMIVPAIPERGTRRDKLDTHIANMMIQLLSKFYVLPTTKQPQIAAMLEELSEFGEKSGFYDRKGPKTVEFMLCSLLMSTQLLLTKYAQRPSPLLAEKIRSTHALLVRTRKSMPGPRLAYYRKLLREVGTKVDALSPKAAALPKARPRVVKKVPKLPERGGKQQKLNAHTVNMMVDLLNKFLSAPKERQKDALKVVDDMDAFADKSGFYTRKGPLQAEFTLCSLMMRLTSLLQQYERRKTPALAKKIKSTRALLTRTKKAMPKERLKYYIDILAALPKEGGRKK